MMVIDNFEIYVFENILLVIGKVVTIFDHQFTKTLRLCQMQLTGLKSRQRI